jgi:hypothetical protein
MTDADKIRRGKYVEGDGKPVLVRLPGLNFNDDKDGKAVAIEPHIGRRPSWRLATPTATKRCWNIIELGYDIRSIAETCNVYGTNQTGQPLESRFMTCPRSGFPSRG